MVKFVLKPAKKGEIQDSLLKKEISVKEYFKLQVENRAKYKVEQLLGINTNETIDFEEYSSLGSEEKKYYLPKVSVNDYIERVKDTHGHIFVKHDLFNHDPELEPKGRYCKDGIAEAFAEFARKEGLSFF
jgi:type I restriction enzyme M protein